jgi:hypothetical protein
MSLRCLPVTQPWSDAPTVHTTPDKRIRCSVMKMGHSVLAPGLREFSPIKVFSSDSPCLGESWTKIVLFEGSRRKIPERTV